MTAGRGSDRDWGSYRNTIPIDGRRTFRRPPLSALFDQTRLAQPLLQPVRSHRSLAEDPPPSPRLDRGQVDDRRREAGQLATVDREVGAGEDVGIEVGEARGSRLAAAVGAGLEDRAGGAGER